MGLFEPIFTRVLSSLKVSRESNFPLVKELDISLAAVTVWCGLQTHKIAAAPIPVEIKQNVKHGDMWPRECVPEPQGKGTTL